MKVINVLCLCFLLHLSDAKALNEDKFFVSSFLDDYGIERVDDKIVRWIYYGVEQNVSPCLIIEMLEPVSRTIEERVEVCEVHVDDGEGGVFNQVMNFNDQEVVNGAYIENIEIEKASLTFSLQIHTAGKSGASRDLNCIVPIKDQKIQPVECVTLSDTE